MLTASGDGTAHIWQCAVHLTNESSSGRMASSEDELDPLERESQAFGKISRYLEYHHPILGMIETHVGTYYLSIHFGILDLFRCRKKVSLYQGFGIEGCEDLK